MGYPVIHPVVQSIEHPGARGGRRFEPCRDGPNASAIECSPFNDPHKGIHMRQRTHATVARDSPYGMPVGSCHIFRSATH